MGDPDYGAPLFGLLSSFEEQTQALRDEKEDLWKANDSLVRRVQGLERDATALRKEIVELKETRKSERERLCEWLDRRIVQQEEALKPRYVSGETKRLIEVELSLLRRYREIVSTSAHTKGTDDPFMPKLA